MKIRLVPKKNPQKREEVKFYANPVNVGRKTLDDIARDISGRSSLTRGDISNVLYNFIDCLPHYLRDGFSIQLGEFGSMRVTLSSKGAETEKAFKTETIKPRVVFTPGTELKRELAANSYESLRKKEEEETEKKKKKHEDCMEPPVIVSTRPRELEADVVKFQNNREKWIAFVGLMNGRPYEIFTGLADDEEGIMLPKTVEKGSIIKSYDADGRKHYDFQFKNKRGFKMTLEGLDSKFEPEYWNYAKLISGVLRYGMPISQVIKLVQEMELNNESINTWKNGVARALKKYLPNGTELKGQKCPNCGYETLVYQEGCLICKNCGASRCG